MVSNVLFTQKIEGTQLVYFNKDGYAIDTKESKKQMSFWSRLWTSNNYDLADNLKEMHRLFEEAKQGNVTISETFLENYETLRGRALTHNLRRKDLCWLTRLFTSKIDISIAKTDIRSEKVNHEVKNPWWTIGTYDGDPLPPDEAVATEIYNLKAVYADPDALLADINPNLRHKLVTRMKDGKEVTEYPIAGQGYRTKYLLQALGLSTVQDFIDKKIYGVLGLELYLADNSKKLTKMLLQDSNGYFELKPE